MESKEILWYIILTIACILPVVLLVRSASSRSRQVTKALKKMLQKLPADHDIWAARGIALDPLLKRIVYTSIDQQNEKSVSIDLSDISKCTVLVNRRAVPEDKKIIDIKDVNVIELSLQLNGPGGHDENLLFFIADPDGPFQSNYYYQLARKWRKRINQEIVTTKVKV